MEEKVVLNVTLKIEGNRALAGQSERVDETRSRYSNSSISVTKIRRNYQIC